ncbi:polymer-forming cytoskeletal protein [Halomicrococcus sp. SG-WS-1]|uniref:polymer-forming cytoskeletal protein n=1 Tax=Halomicrococcus sp. SG-WS-1 TaxID=3439057 RepID=UPI003F7A652B
MSLRSDPLDELSIPDETTVEEHDLVTDSDVIVGAQSTVEFGVRGNNVLAGERVTFGGHIEAEEDCRLDLWCDVDGDVLVGQDAYLGERVHVSGQLMVSGDLDIGDDVQIDDGFEANGWIVIRNPMPTIVFLFVYLSQLLRIGEEEAAESLVDEMLEGAEADPLVVPRNASVNDDAWRVSTPATIGDDCRLHGNVRAEEIAVGAGNEVFGSLRARGDIVVGEGTRIHGDVTTRNGTVVLEADAEVLGDVSCDDLRFHENATADGTMRASGEMTMIRERGRQPTHAEETDETGAEQAEGADSPDDTDADGASESGEADSDDSAPTGEATEDSEGASDEDETATPDATGAGETSGDGADPDDGEAEESRSSAGDTDATGDDATGDASDDVTGGVDRSHGSDEADDSANGGADDSESDAHEESVVPEPKRPDGPGTTSGA